MSLRNVVLLVAGLLVIYWTHGIRNPDHACRHLEQQGYTSVVMEGRYTNTCSFRESEYPFRAISADGTAVTGWICAGLLGYFVNERRS